MRSMQSTEPHIRWEHAGGDRLALAALVVAGAALGAAGLLGCPAAGARPWPGWSALRAVVWVLSLGYSLPTVRGVEVKSLAVALAGGILLVLYGLRLAGRGGASGGGPCGSALDGRVTAAQASLYAVCLLLVWSLLSAAWAADGAVALGATFVLAYPWLVAIGLGLLVRRRDAGRLADIVVVCAAAVGGLALWYWLVRQGGGRAGWPMGNPLSLASVTVPAVLLGAGRMAALAAGGTDVAGGRWRRLRAAGLGACVAVCLACLAASGSRGAFLALAAGAVAFCWLAIGRRGRILLALVIVALLAFAGPWAARQVRSATGGRDASVRLRLYAWRYAMELATVRPVSGLGAGSYSRLATGRSSVDAVRDPLAMQGQVLSHVHSEPLEILCDLGAVGLTLWVFAIVLCLLGVAGLVHLATDRVNWLAVGVGAAVVAVAVDASGGVSWRLPGPGLYMAMPMAIGWIIAGRTVAALGASVGRAGGRLLPSVAAVSAGLAVGLLGAADFAGARCFYAAVSRARAAGGDAAAAASALRWADWAASLRLDPPRRLAARRLAVQLRLRLCSSLLAGGGAEDLRLAEEVLGRAEAELNRFGRIAPGWADTEWLEVLAADLRGRLARSEGREQESEAHRALARELALRYLRTWPLDARRVWLTVGMFADLRPRERLDLLAGTLRLEGRVGGGAGEAFLSLKEWMDRWWAVDRAWRAMEPEQARQTAERFTADARASLLAGQRWAWLEPLGPERARLAARWHVLAGQIEAAEGAALLAATLYGSAGRLLPYSRAAAWLEVAECRLRANWRDAGWFLSAVVEARESLEPLPAGPVRRMLSEVCDLLEQAAAVANGRPAGADAYRYLVCLFCDLPERLWPQRVDFWAEGADLAGGQEDCSARLEVAVCRGDAEAAESLINRARRRGVAVERLLEVLSELSARRPAAGRMIRGLMAQLREAGRMRQ